MRRWIAVLALLAALFPAPARAQWPASGLRLDGGGQRSYDQVSIVPDGVGRFVVYYTAYSNTHVVCGAQRGAMDGTSDTAWHDWELFAPVSDGSHEYFVGTFGPQNTWDVFHMSSGSFDPSWPSPALQVASNDFPIVAPDSAGGCFVITNTPAYTLWRYTSTGTPAPLWPDSGVALGGTSPQLVVDALGRAVVLLLDDSNRLTSVRVLPDGTRDPAWAGAVLASLGSSSLRTTRWFADGDGYWLVWSDALTHATRVAADGTVAAGWPVTAVAAADDAFASPSHLRAFPDGIGGLFVLLNPGTQDGHLAAPVYATHLKSDGSVAPGWSLPGAQLSMPVTGTLNVASFIAGPDSLGGCFVGWGGRLTRLLDDHTPAPGWSGAGDAPQATHDMVYGSCSYGGPAAIGSLNAVMGDGTGAALIALAVYDNCSYPFQVLRLVRFTPPGLAGVAPAARRARPGLRLVGPNPSTRRSRFALALEARIPATFEVLDVAGRVVSREFVVPGAAERELDWAAPGTARAGVYFARLTQRGRSATARFVTLP